MKIIIGFFLLLSSLFAGTVYKTPAFEVKESKLYCASQKEGNIILVSYAVGDIVDGDYVVNNCSKNRTTAEKIIQVQKENEQNLKETNVIIGQFFTMISVLEVIILFVLLMFASDKARGNEQGKIPKLLAEGSIYLSYALVFTCFISTLFTSLYPIILSVIVAFFVSKAIQKKYIFGYAEEAYYKWAF